MLYYQLKKVHFTRTRIEAREYVTQELLNHSQYSYKYKYKTKYTCRLDPLVRGPPGPGAGGSDVYKTRKAMWPYLDDTLDHIRTFLSIIIL